MAEANPAGNKPGSGLRGRRLRVGLWLLLVLLAVLAGAWIRVGDLAWSQKFGWLGTPAPSLSRDLAVGQGLELDEPYLSYLELFFGTFDKKPRGRVELILLRGREAPRSQAELEERLAAVRTLEVAGLKNNESWRWELGDLKLPEREGHLLVRRASGFDSPLTVWLDRAREFGGPPAEILDLSDREWTSSAAPGHISLALGYDRRPRLAVYLLKLTRWGGPALVLLTALGFYLIVLFDWPRQGPNLALSAGSVVLTLLVLELFLRALQGQVLTFDNFLYQDLDLFHSAYPAQFDETLGFIPEENYSSEGPDNLWNKRIHIGKLGIRSNGGPPPGSGPLILCVGDSFTFGAQVHDEETWPALLERELGVRSMNAGVFGYGLDQSVLRAQQLVPLFHPDLLIVGLIQDDILRNRLRMRTGVYKPYFTIYDDRLILHKVPLAKPKRTIGPVRRIGGYSLLVHTLMLRIDKAYWLHGLDKYNYLKRVETAHDQDVEVACRLFQRLAELKRKNGFQVIVFFQYVLDEGSNRFDLIRPCVENAGLELVDLGPALEKLAASDRARYESLFDSHMTAAGNELAARVLEERIRERGLLEVSETRPGLAESP